MSKIKLTIMKNKPEITDEEIQRYMDFDALLHRHATVPKMSTQSGWWLKGVVLLGGMVLVSVLWLKFTADRHPVDQQSPVAEQPVQPFDTPVLLPEEEKRTSPLEIDGTAGQVELKNSASKTDKSIPEKAEQITGNQSATTEHVYVQAKPIDGYNALYQYFNKELLYPEEALKDSIQGIVTVTFVINTEGKPDKITIENSLGVPFDREAIRILENMPLWEPATLNGNPVPSKLSLPLTFQIKTTKDKDQ